MPNQYSTINRKNILIKMNRKANPVTSLAQLAREFGIQTAFYRRNGEIDHTVPSDFRELVRHKIGTSQLNRLRRRKHINQGFEGSTGW